MFPPPVGGVRGNLIWNEPDPREAEGEGEREPAMALAASLWVICCSLSNLLITAKLDSLFSFLFQT